MSNNSMWFNCSRSHSLEPKQRHRFYNHLNFHLLNGLDHLSFEIKLGELTFLEQKKVRCPVFCRALRFRSTASLRARSGKLQVLMQSWSKNLSCKFIQILCLLEHHRHVVWWCLLQFLILFHPFPNSVQSLLWSTGFSGLTTSSACPWAMGIWRQVASWHSSSFGAAMLHQVRRLSWSHELDVMGIRWHLQHDSTSDARWKVWWFRTEKLVNSRRSIDQNSKEPA